MSYSGTCNCDNLRFRFESDPMMQFQCHCTTCQRVFGTSLCALAMPGEELIVEGELTRYTVKGGSGLDMHYNFCAKCGVIIYNEPEVLGGMVYIPAGLLDGQIEFKPTLELWTPHRPPWMTQAPSIIESVKDNGTVERIQELLENLDQRG